jgi:hypothetical protein
VSTFASAKVATRPEIARTAGYVLKLRMALTLELSGGEAVRLERTVRP